jgi:hypothetical protein
MDKLAGSTITGVPEFDLPIESNQLTPPPVEEINDDGIGYQGNVTMSRPCPPPSRPFQEPDIALIQEVKAVQGELATLIDETRLRQIEPHVLMEIRKCLKMAKKLLKIGPGLRILQPILPSVPQLKPNTKFGKQPAFKRKVKSRTAAKKKEKDISEVYIAEI